MFSKKKFLSLSQQQQHKQMLLLLRQLYLEPPSLKLLSEYKQLCHWLQIPPPSLMDKSTIADQFHFHLQRSGRGYHEHELLPMVTQKDLEEPTCPPLDVHVYLERLRSAHNVGSICRSLEAFGLGRLYLCPQTPPPDHPQVQKTSMGTHKWISWEIAYDLALLPRPLIVFETSPSAKELHHFLFPERCTLAFGNEEQGCSKELIASADHVIRIPLYGRKNSLNVANTFAIAAAQVSALRE